jgi:hypothetical protein
MLLGYQVNLNGPLCFSEKKKKYGKVCSLVGDRYGYVNRDFKAI